MAPFNQEEVAAMPVWGEVTYFATLDTSTTRDRELPETWARVLKHALRAHALTIPDRRPTMMSVGNCEKTIKIVAAVACGCVKLTRGRSEQMEEARDAVCENAPLMLSLVNHLEEVLPFVQESESDYIYLLKVMRGLTQVFDTADAVRPSSLCYLNKVVHCLRELLLLVFDLGSNRKASGDDRLERCVGHELVDWAYRAVSSFMRRARLALEGVMWTHLGWRKGKGRSNGAVLTPQEELVVDNLALFCVDATVPLWEVFRHASYYLRYLSLDDIESMSKPGSKQLSFEEAKRMKDAFNSMAQERRKFKGAAKEMLEVINDLKGLMNTTRLRVKKVSLEINVAQIRDCDFWKEK
jgi:hypothetical protein